MELLQLVVYYVWKKQVLSAPVLLEGPMHVRHIDPLRGENIQSGEKLCVQFWQGEQGGNFFVMDTASDVMTMMAMAARAGSTYEWMGCDPVKLGVPKERI